MTAAIRASGRARAASAAMFVAALSVASVSPAGAQAVQELTVDVVGVAGQDFYLSVGADAGLRTGMVFEVWLEGEEVPAGRIRVLSVSTGRSAATFDGEPFPLTRGSRLRLEPTGPADAPIPGEAVAVAAAGARPPGARPSAAGPVLHGSFGASFATRRNVTEWEDAGLPAVERTFNTPATWLNLAATELPAGFRFRLSARAEHRGSTGDLVQPIGLVRVSAAQLTNKFGIVDLALGRTFNPHDWSSGYFDGAVIRAGRSLGAGVAAGFEPERASSGFSTDVPKFSAFADYASSGPAVGYRGTVAATALRPAEETGRVDRTFATLRQTLRLNRFRIGQSLQVDRDGSGEWSVSRLLVDASARLGGGASLRGRYSYRSPVDELAVETTDEFQPYARTLGSVGLGYARAKLFAGVDVGLHDVDGPEPAGLNVSGAFGFRPTTGFGFDVSGAFRDGERSSTLHVRPAVSRRLGPATVRGWYGLYRTDEPEAERSTHTFGARVSAPLGERVRGELSGRFQRGSILRGSGLSASITWLF